MEDFFYAGGLRAFLARLSEFLDLKAMTATGKTIGENIAGAKVWNDEVIRPLDRPVYKQGAIAVLHGNLCPDGAVMKPSAAEPRLLKHCGPALAFENYDEMAAAVEREDLDVTADHVLVLKNGGPQGGPGMPEWGMLPIPLKLVRAGVRDMVRISDARMSGTSYGACVLHVAPESYVGGPLALVKTGDMIAIDVAARTLQLDVDQAELARRRAAWKPPTRKTEPSAYAQIFSEHVLQANEGCDFDMVHAPESIPEPEIH